MEARAKGGPFTDLFDLSARTNSRTVNKRVLEAFVKAGAVDSFKKHRASIFKAIDIAIERGANLQKTQDDAQPSFSDLFSEDTSFMHRKVEYPECDRWDRLRELKMEKEVTGFFMTGHPLDDFERELQQYTTATIEQCLKSTSSKEVFIGAEVVSRREIFTKRGDRMAFLTLEDTTGQIDTVAFSDIYLENEILIKSGDPLWIKGTLEYQEGTSKLLLSKKNQSRILPLRYAYEVLAREMHLFLPIDSLPQRLNQLRLQKLRSFVQSVSKPDGAPLFVHLLVHDKAKTVMKLNQPVPMKREVIGTIREIFNNEGVRIEFR